MKNDFYLVFIEELNRYDVVNKYDDIYSIVLNHNEEGEPYLVGYEEYSDGECQAHYLGKVVECDLTYDVAREKADRLNANINNLEFEDELLTSNEKLESNNEVKEVNNKTLYKLVKYRRDNYNFVDCYVFCENVDLKLLTEEEAKVMINYLHVLNNCQYEYTLEKVEE